MRSKTTPGHSWEYFRVVLEVIGSFLQPCTAEATEDKSVLGLRESFPSGGGGNVEGNLFQHASLEHLWISVREPGSLSRANGA